MTALNAAIANCRKDAHSRMAWKVGKDGMPIDLVVDVAVCVRGAQHTLKVCTGKQGARGPLIEATVGNIKWLITNLHDDIFVHADDDAPTLGPATLDAAKLSELTAEGIHYYRSTCSRHRQWFSTARGVAKFVVRKSAPDMDAEIEYQISRARKYLDTGTRPKLCRKVAAGAEDSEHATASDDDGAARETSDSE